MLVQHTSSTIARLSHSSWRALCCRQARRIEPSRFPQFSEAPMLRHAVQVTRVVALILTSTALLAGSAFAQSNDGSAGEKRADDLLSEVEALKTENAAVQERLRRMEDQQKALLEQVAHLLRRLDGVPEEATPVVPSAGADAGIGSAPQASVAKPEKDDRYQDGIVIWQNP